MKDFDCVAHWRTIAGNCYNADVMRPEQIPYGVKDFKRIRLEGRYYVDKTAYIRELEARADFVFFVRPCRFGKTLLCETLRCYYDIAEDESPTFLRAETKGDELHVTFAHAKALYEFGQQFGERPPFEICGTNGVWKTAVPINLDGGKMVPLYDLKGDTLILTAEGVLAPNRVRYMYQPWTRGCIYNEMSFPLGPFEGAVGE